MSLANEMSPADISAVVNRGNNGGGFFGGDSWLSLIILFLFFAWAAGAMASAAETEGRT